MDFYKHYSLVSFKIINFEVLERLHSKLMSAGSIPAQPTKWVGSSVDRAIRKNSLLTSSSNHVGGNSNGKSARL